MIRNVVFDMGNVLLDFAPERYLRNFVEEEGDWALLRRELFGSVEWVMTDHGALDDEGLCAAVCGRVPERLHGTVRRILAHWYEDMPAYPGVEALIGRLLAQGYRLYVLSNVSPHYDVMRRGIPHIGEFAGEFISCKAHLLKPEPAIFAAFCEKFGLKPEECLFIDDQKINVYGAMRVGMQGLVYYGRPEDVERRLEELNP